MTMAMAASKGAPHAAASLCIALKLIFLIEYALLPGSAFIIPSASMATARISVIPSRPSLVSPSPPPPLQSRAVVQESQHEYRRAISASALFSTGDDDSNNLGVIDLTDEDDDDNPQPTTPQQQQQAPFLSQGEISTDPNLLSPDFNDAKQTRVIIYIILTLLPVLFLIPLMIGSRDLIPLDALPPVELN
jgi:hypothetical protein